MIKYTITDKQMKSNSFNAVHYFEGCCNGCEITIFCKKKTKAWQRNYERLMEVVEYSREKFGVTINVSVENWEDIKCTNKL